MRTGESERQASSGYLIVDFAESRSTTRQEPAIRIALTAGELKEFST